MMRLVRVCVVLFLVLPLLGVAALSFSPTYGMDLFTTFAPSGRWWRELVTDSSWLIALASSALIGCLSACVAISVTLPAALAWRLEGSTIAGHALLLVGAAMTFPPIVLAVGLYQTLMRFGLFDTSVGLALAHLAFTMPVAAVVLGTRFRATPIELYVTARSLGASRTWASLRWLSATQSMTLVGCFAAAVLTSISEVTVALYVTDSLVPTIARRALVGVTRDLKPTGFAALAAWLMLLSVLATPIVHRLRREK